MKTIHVNASQIINARSERIYAVIADYQVGHSAILPRPPFTNLTVEKGGQGAGTIVRAQMKVYGKEYTFRQIVTEPEPGRVLVETDMATGQFTQFVFEPQPNGSQTRVTIASEFPRKPGIAGLMEAIMQPVIIRRIYQQELRILAEYVTRAELVGAAG